MRVTDTKPTSALSMVLVPSVIKGYLGHNECSVGFTHAKLICVSVLSVFFFFFLLPPSCFVLMPFRPCRCVCVCTLVHARYYTSPYRSTVEMAGVC